MINNISYISSLPQAYNCRRNVSFNGNISTLTHTNIGNCVDGLVGKIKVRKGCSEAYLDVYKKHISQNVENYIIKNEKDEIVGNVNIKIVKLTPNAWENKDPSHVFVDELRNFSNPVTPYINKNLEYYKDIGTRLLQIAQRRSDESQCQGNIKLISKGESMDWYINVIGMRQEYPRIPGQKFQIHNPNQLYLPPENKERLSRIQGGL